MSEPEDTAMKPGDERPAGRPAWELPGELKSLEARLAALSPRDDRLDRERLMFLAGQASVVSTKEPPRNLLGLSLDARIWPPAFAGMTAVAATLLALLVTMPAIVEPTATRDRDVATSTQLTESPRQISESRTESRDDVLSTGDAHHRDIEQLFATQEVLPAGVNAAVPANDRDHPTLTPAAWRQIFNGSESSGPPPNNSSGFPTFRGINS